MNRLTIAFFVILALSSCAAGKRLDGPRHIRLAEQHVKEGEIDDAIEEYRGHIAYRLLVDDRPDWENPYFYLLIIGDLQLTKGDVEAALQSYEDAESHGVDRGLVADRYRHAGGFLAERGSLQEALRVLTRYRDRDPLLIDAMRDRLARELVEREDSGRAGK